MTVTVQAAAASIESAAGIAVVLVGVALVIVHRRFARAVADSHQKIFAGRLQPTRPAALRLLTIAVGSIFILVGMLMAFGMV